MGLLERVNTYFNPSKKPFQLEKDSWQRDTLGFVGLGLAATAATAHFFFKARPQTTVSLLGAGVLFYASYHTGKSGYAYLVGGVAAAAMIYKTVDAIQNDRLWVTVHFDIADIIRSIRENHPQRR